MTEVNVPLLRKAVEWVEEQDKLPVLTREWDQSDWQRTARNRAFREAHSALRQRDRELVERGEEPMSNSEFNKKRAIIADALIEVSHCGTAYCVAGYVGQICDERYKSETYVNNVHVSVYAANQLGLGEHQAEELFDACNTAVTVRRIAERIAGEKL